MLDPESWFAPTRDLPSQGYEPSSDTGLRNAQELAGFPEVALNGDPAAGRWRPILLPAMTR